MQLPRVMVCDVYCCSLPFTLFVGLDKTVIKVPAAKGLAVACFTVSGQGLPWVALVQIVAMDHE